MLRLKKKKRLPLFLILLIALTAGFGIFSWNSWQKDWQSTRKFMPVRVEKVLAGDTFTAYIPTLNVIQDVKMIGIAIPSGEQAETARTVTQNMLEGKAVYIETDTQLNNYANEILAYVWLQKPEKITEQSVKAWNYNCLMIRGGYAEPDLNNPYNKKYNEILKESK